jgi:purine-binding chemotaxis protein CheW
MSQALVVLVAGERFGLPVARTGSVFRVDGLTRVPLTAPAIAGLHNLRGKTLAVVHLARLLDPDAAALPQRPLAVTIETDVETYAVIVDEVEEVAELPDAARLEGLGHGDPRRVALTAATYRLGQDVLPVLDVNRLFEPMADAGVFAPLAQNPDPDRRPW